MKTTKYISIQQFITYYKVPESFISSLFEYELIEVITLENENYINISQIKDIEKLIRLHYDLNINLEGIDAIRNLINKVALLEKEIIDLNNKLNLYEGD